MFLLRCKSAQIMIIAKYDDKENLESKYVCYILDSYFKLPDSHRQE